MPFVAPFVDISDEVPTPLPGVIEVGQGLVEAGQATDPIYEWPDAPPGFVIFGALFLGLIFACEEET